MKGIVLCGGAGSRLHPITLAVSKQLLPVYDKPMVYYPLSVLMLAGIRDILIICRNSDLAAFQRLLGTGEEIGLNLEYAIQDDPRGIAEAFIIGEEFIAGDAVCLVLGDNLFWGQGFTPVLRRAAENKDGAILFGYQVKDPERFGVIEFDDHENVISIEEKPTAPKSDIASTGLYFYDAKVVDYAKCLRPSARNELEITALNQIYLEDKNLRVEKLGRGFAWLDTGTCESLLDASMFVETIEKRQGLKIACLEEIAFVNGWLEAEDLRKRARLFGNNEYFKYLSTIA